MNYRFGLMIPSAEAARVAGEIEQYINDNGGRFPDWYSGIASDPRQRLFVDHNVTENPGFWIYHPCSTDGIAREVEQHFLGKGCKGGPGGGDRTTKYVYAYKITNSTVE